MSYLSWNTNTITDFSPANIEAMYDRGYVFTRLGRGVMQQTRSVRVQLRNFDTTSENRRILKKTEGLELSVRGIPYEDYDWSIGKMAKDFYTSRGADFSANKAKELLTSPHSNFNVLLTYTADLEGGSSSPSQGEEDRRRGNIYEFRDERSEEQISPRFESGQISGHIAFCISYESDNILHYSYPFYDPSASKDLGLGMMLRAIQYAKDQGKEYVYLGSLQRPGDAYKLQFQGVEWFDTECGTNAEDTRNERGRWSTDTDRAKNILNS